MVIREFALLGTIWMCTLSCQQSDDCIDSSTGLCSESTIVGRWEGNRTTVAYRADTIFSEFTYHYAVEFKADGTAQGNGFLGSVVEDWFWFPERSQLMLYTPTQELITPDSNTITVLSSVDRYQVSRCSTEELWLSASVEGVFSDPNDRYEHEIRLAKQP